MDLSSNEASELDYVDSSSVKPNGKFANEPTIEVSEEVSEDSLPRESLDSVVKGGRMVFTPRGYQLEMYAESLRKNIIVAMDTGSGKTHIAVLRIKQELESISSEKLIWFIAPTVSLCAQQHYVLAEQISMVTIKFLSSLNNVESWTSKALWDAALKNVRVVVSTPQVLLDAMTHGFVSIEDISLLVFDEAHNCVGNNAGARIMRDFYEHNISMSKSVPAILGLSASPIMNLKPAALEKIETTLSAVCRTPSAHRDELLRHVNVPELCQTLFIESPPIDELVEYTRSLASLHAVYRRLDIKSDPYVLQLQEQNTERSQRQLHKVFTKHKTWCQDQMKSFCNTSAVICQELGPWASNYYISHVVTRFLQLVDSDLSHLGEGSAEETRYLARALGQVELIKMASELPAGLPMVSHKVSEFIKLLPRDSSFKTIVFVKQRATVAVLARLLSVHPQTRTQLRVGTMVGVSQSNQRAVNVADIIGLQEQKDTLEKFRHGNLDLVIATSVLEEGIDIPACNFVVCFDPPANLKSFVQRRGRARMQVSKLVLMQATSSNTLGKWQEAEAEMKRIYADDMRRLQELEEIEKEEEVDGREFRIESTGALLHLDNAVSHLYHFCAVLPSNPYVELRPEFIFIENQLTQVILPLSVDESVRTAYSKEVWRSEKNGIKDAAFEAYLALYRVGLVNDNLLPLLRHDAETDEFSVAVEKQSALVTIHELHNPWVDVARAWSFPATEKTLGRPVVTLYDIARGTHISMEMIIPIELPDLPPLKLYWDAATEMVVNIGPWVLLHEPSEDQLGQIHDGTRNLLKAAFGHRFQVEQKQLVVLFTPPSFDHHIVVVNEGDVEKVRDLSHLEDRGASMGLIRHIHEKGVPYIFEKWLDSKPPANMVKHPYSGYDDVPVNAPHLALSKVSRREDFLNPTGPVEIVASDKPYSYVLPVDACVIDSMTFQLVQLGRLLPSIMHYISTYLIAMHLSKTILSPISFPDLTLVLTAITASSASRQTNYQRLEFLGDSILKTCTSLQLLALYPNWHEGYLSFKKDRLVANSRLARAAIECGLDKYVSTKPFTGRKWRPLYISNILAAADQEGAKRNVSSKVLADVVESLIGASYLSGGMSAALSCISIFLPELPWRSLSLRREEVFAVAPFHVKLPAAFGPLTTMLDYRFNKPVLLLDALSHASCSSGTASWERLEFLGDAILDNIIVESIFGHKPQLSHVQMHRLRTAVVNADFLAFICLEFSVDVEVGIVVPVAGANTSPPPKETQREGGKAEFWKPASLTESKPLWAFMRHGSQKLGAVQRQMSTRHASLRAEIKTALHTSQSHPWALLAKLQAPKFYSDLIESVLGALYIDSGNLDVCTAVLNKMGVMPYLERVLREGVHVIHPKEELGILADQEPVAYRVQLNRGIVGGKEHREWTCQVMVGEKEVASVGGGVGREEIQVCAAERAVATLKAQRKEIDENEGTQREGALLEGQASDVEQDFGGVRLNVESDGDVDMGS